MTTNGYQEEVDEAEEQQRFSAPSIEDEGSECAALGPNA